MKLSQFKFRLPEEQVALYPHSVTHEFTNDDGTQGSFRITRSDECRLMVVHRRSKTIDLCRRDRRGRKMESEPLDFRNVLDYFHEGDTFVLNDTKVFPARLYGTKEKTDARIEVFLLRELNPEMRLWDVLVEPARKIRMGNKLYFGEDQAMVAEVIDNTTSRGRTLRFLYDGPHDEFKKALYALGEAPLPNYIKREPVAADLEAYQTVYATVEGAVVAPTAGIHFSSALMKRLELKGVERGFLTVHCGLGAFRTIEVEDLTKHKMDSEEMSVDQKLVDMVNHAKDHGKQVCAVGTSTLRGISSAVSMGGHMQTYSGWTNKFIFPPYDFTVTTALVSGFHLSQSTLLMMVAAFGGFDLVMHAYTEAIKEGYRFGAYGDAMLILP